MNKIIITAFLVFQIPIFMIAQKDNTLDMQADIVDSTSDSDLQIFKEKFNQWIKSSNNNTLKKDLNTETMVNNFILFSEDGLIMKDLKFHSVESCKKEIAINLPNSENKNGQNHWIYVTMESQVNKNELIEVLMFLRKNKIDYYFGQEDEFIPLIIKK